MNNERACKRKVSRGKANIVSCVAFCGGIATGKSTLSGLVAEDLARKGIAPLLLDFDQLRRIYLQKCRTDNRLRRLLAKGGETVLCNPIEASRFILGDTSRIIQFGEVLGEKILERIKGQTHKESNTIIILEWPGPLPKVLRRSVVSKVVTVTCSVREQVKRLSGGDLSLAEVRRRIRMQRRVAHMNLYQSDTIPEFTVDTTNAEPKVVVESVAHWICVDDGSVESRRRAA